MTEPASLDWAEANHAVLVAELGRLRARLAREDEAPHAAAIAAMRAAMTGAPALDQLAAAFDLSRFERDVLLLCAGVELDAGFAAQCAEAAGAPQRPHATFGLALAALADPHWSALTPARPLRSCRLLELQHEHVVATSRLNIDERVLHYLAGVNYLDPRLRPLLRPQRPAPILADGHARTSSAITTAIEQREGPLPVIELVGDDPEGQKDIAAHAAGALGLGLYVLRASDIPSNVHELEALSVLWNREAILLGAALLIQCSASASDAATAARLLERPGALLFVASSEPLSLERPALRFHVDRPSAAEQKALWQQTLGPIASQMNGALDGVALQFRLSASAIARAAHGVRHDPSAQASPDAALWSACRTSTQSRLDDLAQRVQGSAAWDDLVLPEPQKATLRQLAAHVKHRAHVYERWGFARQGTRGLGITALFAGESGTGKTMAAEVLANTLHLDLYRIDLATVVSKYIGETEKNLRRIFDTAETSGAILLFDEADALFGKRSEVKDSHDRYANIEVSYLLQRMEAYRGLAILTTNQKSALDVAFQRRLRFIVPFPFPDQGHREQIWRRVFPSAAPLAELDFTKLARLNVAGGSIKNIALNAAFSAAQDSTSIDMKHLLLAAHGEGAKRERPFTEAETRGWA